VRTLNRISIGSLGRRSDRPVVGGRQRSSWLRGLILMYSQSTSGSTQPGERPVTARSGDVSSTRQHSIMAHATEEKRECHCSFLVLISNATFHSAHCNQRLRSSSTSSICLFGRKKNPVYPRFVFTWLLDYSSLTLMSIRQN